jgi:hypothetical protein
MALTQEEILSIRTKAHWLNEQALVAYYTYRDTTYHADNAKRAAKELRDYLNTLDLG